MLGFRPILLALTIAAFLSAGLQAEAQPRSAAAPRQAPALPQSGHQSEAIDLNEGKTAPQMFSSDCAVCHQRPNGLAKGRSAGQLAGFLRQHYTTGTQQAGMLAAYLTSDGLDRGTPAPAVARDAPDRPGAGVPVVRPPAPVGSARRPDGDDPDGPGDGRRKPAATEASRPDRDGPTGRKPAREDTRKPPSASARASKPAAPEIKQSEVPAAAAAAPDAPATEQAPADSPAEEKAAAPPPPAVPEIRI